MTAVIGYRPLYRQVYDIIIRRVAEGTWRPGESLPSEHNLARELRVSQGTIRKVLDALTAEKLLERRQGKGTFIAEHTQERTHFRFFRLSRPGGRRMTPQGTSETVKLRASRADERAKLDLARSDRVVEITRTRAIEGTAAVRERIMLPAQLFPGLERLESLPNSLYTLYQSDYRINIVAAHEEVSAQLATDEDQAALKVNTGDPILVIDRVAVSLQDRKVEWRISRVRSENLVYAVTLS